MKTMLRYAAWNWRLYRRAGAVLLGAATLLEAALLLSRAASLYRAATSYDALLSASGASAVFGAVMAGTLLLAQWPLIAAGAGRTRAAYTILTFRMPRWQLYAGQTLATALGALVALAWQTAVWLGLYWPVTAIQDAVAGRYFGFTVPSAGRLWWAVATSQWFGVLVPRTPGALAVWVVCLLALAMLAAAVGFHRGAVRLVALGMAGAGFVCSMLVWVALTEGQLSPVFWSRGGVPLAVLAGLTLLGAAGAVAALCRSELAR